MARHAPQPRRFRRLALLLAAALAPCLTRAAEYVPDGESGGFIRLDAGECGGAESFTVSLAGGGTTAGAGAIRPQTLISRRDGGGWTLYACGWPDDLDGTYDLLVHCGEAAGARTVSLPGALRRHTRRMDVALLLDDSHSMRSTDPQRLRVAAARLFAQMAGMRGNIETLTIVAFNRRARLLLPPTPPGDAAAVDAALARLDASGATDLDSAFALAYAELDRLPPSRKIAVVLSDGRDEPGRYAFGHRRFAARQWPVHTIGLSDDIDEQALQMIAASTGGAYHRARNTESLARIFRDLAAALQTSVTVGEWNLRDSGDAAFPVDDTLRLLSLALLDRAETPSACALQAPDGKSHALSSAWAADAFADLFAPAAGRWKVQGISGEALLSVTGSSSLELVPFPVTRPAEAGKPIPVAAFVLDGNRLIKSTAIVARLADGTTSTLRDDGLNADGDDGDGIYGAYLRPAAPDYTRFAFIATGQTAAGLPFQRLVYRDIGTVTHKTPVAGATASTVPPAPPPAARWTQPARRPLPRPAGMSMPAAPRTLEVGATVAWNIRPAPMTPVASPAPTISLDAVTPAETLLPLDAVLPPEPPARNLKPGKGPVDFLTILLLIAAILFLCWLISRWFARPTLATSRMTTFFLMSLLMHAILAVLLMDLLVQTRVITVEQISPRLAVSLQAVEASLGIQLTPPGPAVPLAEQARETDVARAAAAAAVMSPKTVEPPRPDASPASELRAAMERATPAIDQPRMVSAAESTAPAPPPTPAAPVEAIEVVKTETVEKPLPQQEPEPLKIQRATAEPKQQPVPSAPSTLPRQKDQPRMQMVAVEAPQAPATPLQVAHVTTPDKPDLPTVPSQAAEPERLKLPEPDMTATERTPEAPSPRSLPLTPAPSETRLVASSAAAPAAANVRPTSSGAPEPTATRLAAAKTPSRSAPLPTLQQSDATADSTTPSLPATPSAAETAPERVVLLSAASGEMTAAKPVEKPQPVLLARAKTTESVTPAQAGGAGALPPRPAAGQAAAPASVTLAAVPVSARGAPAQTLRRIVATSPNAAATLPALPDTPLPGAEALAQAPLAAAATADTAPAASAAQKPSATELPRPALASTEAGLPVRAPEIRPEPASEPQAHSPPEMAPPATAVARTPGTLAPVSGGPLAFRIGAGGEGSRQVTIGLAQYGGDWDWARHAMTFLGHQLRERTRLAINAGDRVVSLASPDLGRLPFVYMTGHKDFRLSDAEVANLRAYLRGGGYLWVDDSTHFQDETFDTAFRREIARILPDAALERLDMTFEGFRTGYDLTKGYKGYAIPPGDKYRLDYIEGARLGDRVAVVYTRNDYGDGLNIDEHTHPLHESLTDLGPAEMQEGAIRMGINLTLYFLTHGKGEATFVDRTAATLRQQREAIASAAPAGAARSLPLFAAGAAWQQEEWSDPGRLVLDAASARLSFTVGAQRKCAFSLLQEPPVEVTADDVVVLQVRSGLRGGARLALAFTIEGRYFESRPVYIKPGDNLALFPCGEASFKTEAGGWAYRDLLPARAAIQRMSLLVYSPTPGELVLSQPRIIRTGRTP